MNIEYRIDNVVAEADTGTKLNLQQLATDLEDVEYDPARFPGLICHIKDPESAIIFFTSGKLLCTGGNNIERVQGTLLGMIKKLKDMGVKINNNTSVDIQNIVASYDLHRILNLKNIAITIGKDKAEYDPARFEGLVYRQKGSQTVSLLYESGKIVCTGAKRREDLETALGALLADLERTGLMS